MHGIRSEDNEEALEVILHDSEVIPHGELRSELLPHRCIIDLLQPPSCLLWSVNSVSTCKRLANGIGHCVVVDLPQEFGGLAPSAVANLGEGIDRPHPVAEGGVGGGGETL